MQSGSSSSFVTDRLRAYVAARRSEASQIPTDRKAQLDGVAEYVGRRLDESECAKLIFICTHNSRRSHLSQIWAQVAATACELNGVSTYSGGTEATAFNPRAVEALRRAGMEISTMDATAANPVYSVRYSQAALPLECFSKRFDQSPNPTEEFCAVMTCSEADQACPLVVGCELRAPIRYSDPKEADDTPQEAEVYDERSRQIAREMFYLMSRVK